MLQMKFDLHLPAGLRDIHVWKCGGTDRLMHRRTEGRQLESHPISSPGVFGSGELKILTLCDTKMNIWRMIGIMRLAEWWQTVIVRDEFFYPILTRILFLAHLILETNIKKASRKAWIRWAATWWHHFNNTMTSRVDMPLFVFIFPTG